MAEHSAEPVKTFSIGFADEALNELPRARLVAERFATDHHELMVEPDAVELLPKLVRHYGEPFGDHSALPCFYLAELAREHVTVALNGDGGDESFAGYQRYASNRLAARLERLPAPLRRPHRGRSAAGWPTTATCPRAQPRRRARRRADARRGRALRAPRERLRRRASAPRSTRPSSPRRSTRPTPTTRSPGRGRRAGDAGRGPAARGRRRRPTCPATCWRRSTSRPWPTRSRPARRCSTTR